MESSQSEKVPTTGSEFYEALSKVVAHIKESRLVQGEEPEAVDELSGFAGWTETVGERKFNILIDNSARTIRVFENDPSVSKIFDSERTDVLGTLNQADSSELLSKLTEGLKREHGFV